MIIMNIGKYIDFTLLSADAKSDEIIDLCNNAVKFGFQAVCVSPTYVMLSKELLRGRNVSVCTVISYPLGTTTNIVKLMEAKDAIEKGADELDVVMNVGALKDGKVQYVLNELQAIKKIAGNRIIKCIIECGLLSREEIITASKICLNSGINFIQINSGFIGMFPDAENIALIKNIVHDKIKIKVVGGIVSYRICQKFIKSGVSRIGTSKGEQIMKKFLKSQKKVKK